MSDVQREEDEALKFWQVVVAKFKVEDNGTFRFQHCHRLVDVGVVGELAEDVEAVLLHRADARIDVLRSGTCLTLATLLTLHGQRNGQNQRENKKGRVSLHNSCHEVTGG